MYKEIRLETFQKEPQAFNSKFEETVQYPDRFWEEKLTNKDLLFVFAQHRYTIVGVMSLTFNEKRESYHVGIVHGEYVNKNFRGLGVGKSL